MATKSIRTATATGSIELRELEGQPRQIVGVIPFGSKSVDMGFVEIINPTAFNKTLQDRADVKALLSHDSSRILGRVKNKSLRLSVDEIGLRCEVDLPQTSYANDAWELIKNDYAPQMSFGFSPVKEEWVKDEKTGEYTVYLNEVRLYEVSFCVAFPAYEATDSEARARAQLAQRGISLDDFYEVVLTGRPSKAGRMLDDYFKEMRSLAHGDETTAPAPGSAVERFVTAAVALRRRNHGSQS